MMSNLSDEKVNKLDNMLINALNEDKVYDRNIYLLTSHADDQFLVEVQPNLGKFIKYNNFNYLLSKSILVRAHSQVTVHNLPLILGIFYSLSQGEIPKFGYCELGGDDLKLCESPTAAPLTVLKKIKVKEGRFYPEVLSV